MLDRSPRALRIQQLNSLLGQNPDAIAALYERAGLLREQGLFEEAKRDYLELIRYAPTDFEALNDFGTLVLDAGYRDAARSLFSQAVRHHPNNTTGHVNLANLLFRVGEIDQARIHFEIALKFDPGHIHAHRGMGNLLADIGDDAGARRHRDRAFKDHFLIALPYRGDGRPVSVLLLVSAAGGNIPTSSLLDERRFATTVLVVEYFDPKLPLPFHDLIFNSIGDADLCEEGLGLAYSLLARTDRPVINHPNAVLKTGRASNAERLRGIPDVVVPRMATLSRHLLAGSGGATAVDSLGFSFPILLRTPGFHTGRNFIRVENRQQLNAAATELCGNDVWIIEEVDARDDKDEFRKYRVMIIDKKLYPLHVATSRHWKVHYFTADMATSSDNRAKDAEFLGNMTNVVGRRGVAAIERISETLDLDYAGIDFGINLQGDILFFEANATMFVQPPLLDPKWSYRRQAVEKILSAVHAMLIERAADGSSHYKLA